MVYVLNTFVNTITAIDLNKVLRGSSPPNYVKDKEIIADYREAVLEAYKGLFLRLLQYLKDCFCDKFLIDCPQCNEKNKVYLGTIEIHDSRDLSHLQFQQTKICEDIPDCGILALRYSCIESTEEGFYYFLLHGAG